MSEIEQLKKRIIESGHEGIKTAFIRDDYEPIGQQMINDLCDTGNFVSHRTFEGGLMTGPWTVWAKEFAPKF